MVVTVHVVANYFHAWDYEWATTNALGSAVRMAVPLFVMASGAIVVTRVEPLEKTLVRITKIVVPLLAWSLIYLVWQKFSGTMWGFGWTADSWNPLRILIRIIESPVMFILPFLYAFVGLYLFYPILQSLFLNPDKRVRIYFVVVSFIAASLLTTAGSIATRSLVGINLTSFALFPMYAVLGALVYPIKLDRRGTVVVWLLAAASIVTTAAVTVLASRWQGGPSQLFYEYHAPNVVLASVFLFMALRGSANALPASAKGALSKLAPLCFGVFFVHVLVLYYAQIHLRPPSNMPFIGYLLGLSLFVGVVSFALSWLLRRVGLGRILAPS